MGTAEEKTPSKPPKATSSVQETPATMTSYPDWSNSMQMYYGSGATPPFLASTVAPPAPHPYMWGGHHPMPPYGTPIHYAALYPPGGVYAHPNIETAANASGAETEGKILATKDQTSAKKTKGNTGSEKTTETGKTASGSGNEGASESADSGSEGSSEATDDNNKQQELSGNKKGNFDQQLVHGANTHTNAGDASTQASVTGKPVSSMSATNLNIEIDLWNGSHAGAVKLGPRTGASSTIAPGMVGPDHQWVQDERELKRQKRKQSNRESARRSRLRKQAECEELQRRVDSLGNDNDTLREELQRLAAECDMLTSENDSIKEELTQLCGPSAISGIRERNASGEGNS